jgi:hypothetical protein
MLRVGETLKGTVDDTDPVVETDVLRMYDVAATVGKTYRIQVERAGPYHIELRSYDFDTYLVLRDASGEPIAEDDDGWVEVHSRIQVERMEAGRTYRVDACALHGIRGEFELRLAAGVATPLSGDEWASANLEEARRRLAFAEDKYGPEHLSVARSLDNLANWLLSQRRCARTESS